MLAFKVLLIARMDPLKYLMEKPVLDGKTVKCVRGVLLPLKMEVRLVIFSPLD